MPERILTVGMMGEDVTALHGALSARGLKIPNSETARGFFGQATRNAVLEIQNRNRLTPTGQVDKATVAVLDWPGASSAAFAASSGPKLHDGHSSESVTDAHLNEGQFATDSALTSPARLTSRGGVLSDHLANTAKLASPLIGAATLQATHTTKTEIPAVASSAERTGAAKKSSIEMIESASTTPEPFVMVTVPSLIPMAMALPKPAPQALVIKGNLTIFTLDKDLKPSRQDFHFYELSAEITGLPEGGPKVLRWEFADELPVRCGQVDLNVNSPAAPEGELLEGVERTKRYCTTNFEFAVHSLFVQAGTATSVEVVVKSFDGVRVWSKEFSANDALLHDLPISIPLQRPISLIPSTKHLGSTKNKKLRGQILELSKKCKLKDLTIVIQAKAAGDAQCRIVSAGRADSAGNFSLPYPLGVFTEAQALISLTPNCPVSIKITEVRNGNETIAEDFLYLLLGDIECPHDEGREDCDCNGKKQTSRLPDQADLIGSGEYTQDIGGSCINLSTPNRTLSEFNYQAIVRTSDPDVADYNFTKVDEPKSAGLDPVRTLEVSRALSALDSGLGNMSFQDALPAAALSTALTQFAALRTHIEKAQQDGVDLAIKCVDALISGVVSSLAQNVTTAVLSSNSTSDQVQIGASSTTVIETEILRVFAELVPDAGGTSPETNDASWDKIEGAIRQATLNVGGMPLTDTFFFQFGGWRVGHAFASYNEGLIKRVARKAAEAGASGTMTLQRVGASLQPRQNANAVSYLVALANDLKAHLIAAQLIRWETRYELKPGRGKRDRRPVDLDNLVAWQDDKQNLSLYQAVTVATGHILHYKSEFKADGYSLGDVVYSLPLAPGQEKQIVVLDASHRLVGTESQSLSQAERLSAGIFDERSIISGLGGRIGESMRGASSANTSGISAGFGTGGQGYGGGNSNGTGYGGSGSAVIGIAGGVANANSTAWQDSSRDISQHFEETLRQSIMQNANAYRQLNASIVTTVEEGQRYGVTSEVVANHNHCHALTIMYFEVLRHYAIFQRLSSVEECVFVPLLMTNFKTENIYKWRDVLAKSLLPMPADTYLQTMSDTTSRAAQQHPLLRAFDANERILTNYANVDYPVGCYDDEPIQFIRGDMRIRVKLPRPRTRFDRIISLPVTKQIDTQGLSDAVKKFSQDSARYAAKAAFTAGISTAFEKPPVPPDPTEFEVLATEAMSDSFMRMDANFQSVPPAQCMRIINFRPKPISFGGGLYSLVPIPTVQPVDDFFADNREDRNQWQAYADILGYSNVEAMLNAYFKGNLISEWDSIFYTDIAPLVFEKIISRIRLSEFSSDFSSGARYEGGEKTMAIGLTGSTSKKRNQLPLELTLAIKDQNFKKLKEYITFNVEDLTISYFTAHYRGVLYAGNVNDDLFDDTALYIPESPDEKRNLRKEDGHLVYKLMEHLNSNIEFYNKALWYNLDSDRRFMLLDGFDIQTFNDFGLPIGKRSLASVVKNELITVTGNSMVFPVAAGYRVSQSYIVENTGNAAEVVSLLDHYQPLTPIEPYRISVPTRGVFAEAVQGACNACEKIETDRLQDWNKFPNTDKPTAISPITVPTPGVAEWRAALKDFATPIVNIQNAPATPAPGAGLDGLSELLGKSGVFKDVTGLEGNQQNVIRTYLSNQENAKAFGEMAKEMAMQQHNTENSGKIMDQIKTAKSSGDITKQDAGQLVKDHLQQQIDGGGAKKAELDKAIRESLPSVAQAGVNAINRGRGDIATTISHPDGFVESVTVKNATAADQISGPLPVDMAAELDWARLHPVPETAEADMVLSLWNYPVGESELALEHRSAIDQFLKQAIQAATLGGSAVPSKVEIYITGHASKSGDNAANETVSRRRAENVASYLEYRGILRQQMRVDWAGSKEPADPGSSGFSAARNRRVDVYQFVPSEAETKQPPAEGPGSDVEVPVSPSSDESKSIESILNHIDEGAKVFEVVTTLAQMGGELAALEAAAGLVGLFGNVALLAWTVIQIADARNEGLLHDATMGWAYGITWAIDDASAIRASRPRPPVPTGATYRRDNPGFSSDAWEERQQAFEATVEAGIDLVIQSGASLFDERHDLYKGLILKLAILITKLGDKEGHKEFVTQIFRATYSKHDTVDHFHRENWWLDWPTMQAGMLKF